MIFMTPVKPLIKDSPYKLTAVFNPSTATAHTLSGLKSAHTGLQMKNVPGLKQAFQFCAWGGTSGGVYAPCIYSHARLVPAGDSGFCCCVCMTPFERDLTPLFVDSILYILMQILPHAKSERISNLTFYSTECGLHACMAAKGLKWGSL